MKERNNILGNAIVAALSLSLFILSCDSQNSWTPKSPASSPIEGFETSSSFSFNEWVTCI